MPAALLLIAALATLVVSLTTEAKVLVLVAGLLVVLAVVALVSRPDTRRHAQR